MTGCIDLTTSRRTNFDQCKYWKRDDTEVDLDKYVHEHKFDGVFYARETSGKQNQKQIVDAFMFDQNTANIVTDDYVEIKAGDIVEFEGHIWNVQDVQEVDFDSYKQYLRVLKKRTYLRLKR